MLGLPSGARASRHAGARSTLTTCPPEGTTDAGVSPTWQILAARDQLFRIQTSAPCRQLSLPGARCCLCLWLQSGWPRGMPGSRGFRSASGVLGGPVASASHPSPVPAASGEKTPRSLWAKDQTIEPSASIVGPLCRAGGGDHRDPSPVPQGGFKAREELLKSVAPVRGGRTADVAWARAAPLKGHRQRGDPQRTRAAAGRCGPRTGPGLRSGGR